MKPAPGRGRGGHGPGSTAGEGREVWSRRPRADEHAPFYSGYVKEVPDGDVLEVLRGGSAVTRDVLDSFPAGAETHRYAPGRWSVRQVVGHLTDTERVFAYRAVHMARSDPSPLPGMDQEVWAEVSHAHRRPLSELLDELEAVRAATLRLFGGLPDEVLDRRGEASGVEFTVRSLAWITAGHEIHHRMILAERYLPTAGEGRAGA